MAGGMVELSPAGLRRHAAVISVLSLGNTGVQILQVMVGGRTNETARVGDGSDLHRGLPVLLQPRTAPPGRGGARDQAARIAQGVSTGVYRAGAGGALFGRRAVLSQS